MPIDDKWKAVELDSPSNGLRLLEWLPLRRRRGTHEDHIRDVLTNTPLFHNISRQDWKLLSNLFHERVYEEGEIIFEKGMPGLGMYVILEGTVSISSGESDGDQEFARLVQGDFFGEMAVIQEGVRNATATAVSPCRLLGIFRPQLRELLRDRPKLGVTFYERLSAVLVQRLKLADEKLLERSRIRGKEPQ